MKQSTGFILTLSALSLSIGAQAACDQYPSSVHTLSLPATITVPDSLPVGSVIIRKAFDGIAPGFTINCLTATLREFGGRYSSSVDVPGAGVTAHPTNVPGVAIRVMVTDASGLNYPHSLISASDVMPAGSKTYSNVSAEAIFYKTRTIQTETLHPANLLYERWATDKGFFSLSLITSVRFIRATATCDLAAGDVNRTITLPAVRVSDFTTSNSAGVTAFELTANCSDTANVTFGFSGTPATADPSRFANTGTARGLDLWLYASNNNTTITPNGTDSARTVTVSNNRAVLPLGAAYYKTGTVVQGTFSSTATVSITYN